MQVELARGRLAGLALYPNMAADMNAFRPRTATQHLDNSGPVLPAPRGSLFARRTLKRVLVVDDVESIRRLHALALTRAGYDVHTAADGEQAWAALHGADYDLLVTDNNMPRLTGLDLVSRMRRSGIRIPVIFISGSAEVADICVVQKLDAAAVLPKAAPLDEVVDVVKRVVPIPPSARSLSNHDRETMSPFITSGTQPRLSALNE
jgi:CheY-like chemotaxis protein